MSELHVPAHVAPYVDVLGVDGAVSFMLQFGGTEVRLSERPRKRSQLVDAIGRENVIALAKRVDEEHVRVPIPKSFIARYFYQQGLSPTKIARMLHVTNVTMSAYLKDVKDKRQLDLFGS